MNKLIKTLIVVSLALLIGCSCDEEQSEPREKPEKPTPIEECVDKPVKTNFTKEDRLVKDTYAAWFNKNFKINSKNKLAFSAGRLVEDLLLKLGSNISEPKLDKAVIKIMKIATYPGGGRLRLINDKDASQIRKLLLLEKTTSCKK